MNSETCEVAVIGLGGVGSAAFAALAERDVDVIAVDRWTPPHEMGSSHGQSRIFRVAYFEHPDYVPLARDAREKWLQLQEVSKDRVFIQSGGAWIGPEDCRVVARSRHAAEEHGLKYEMLGPDEVGDRWPALRMPQGSVCFHEQAAGLICPEHAIAAFMQQGTAHGGRTVLGKEVLRITPEGNRIHVDLEGGTIKAERVVLTAGAWSGGFLNDAGIQLEVQRQVLGWVRPRNSELLKEGRLPVWVFSDNDTSIQYGFPICEGLPGPEGMKLARHSPGEVCDTESVRRNTDATDEEFLLSGLQDRIPDAAGELIEARVCMYTMSPDEHFIIDRHPTSDRITIGCGFSGHGFKFCPVLGEALAEICLEGRSSHPVDFLSLKRLQSK